MKRIITLTTDFGLRDGFVGAMKGVILNINPQATLVDISHDIAPQNVEQGAFLFANAARFFPANTIHVVVVDPGVGSARRPIAMQIGETIMVAPDNGVLTQASLKLQVSSQNPQPQISVVHLNRPEYWLATISRTFHGRDIFAPVAAHLSLGVPIEKMGEPIDDWVRLEIATAARNVDGTIVGKVMHIDHFGNLITNVPAEMLGELNEARIETGRFVLSGIRQTYAEAKPGEPLVLVSSSGNLEIAMRDGNAAVTLGIKTGDQVLVK